MEDSLEEGTLVEDPLMEEGHLGPQEEKDHKPSRASRTCKTYNCADTSNNFGYHCFRKYL